MKYPLDLDLDRHGFVEFALKKFSNPLRARRAEEHLGSIQLYVPPGITKTDGVTYANTDLKAAKEFADLAASGGQELNVSNAAGLAGRLMARGAGRKLLSAGANLFVTDDILDDQAVLGGLDLAQGIAINPNTKATLERINPRSFTLQFDFIPSSEGEANHITDITQKFRTEMYPEFGSGTDRTFFERDQAPRADLGDTSVEDGLFSEFFLKYPNVFEVSVYPAGRVTERQHITKFKDSFLTQVSVSHAGAGTTYYKNGAPIVTQMTLIFQETETPTKADISGGGF